MLRRMSEAALLLAALSALAVAYPGIGGGRGLFRVQDALVEPEAGVTLSFDALARNAEFSPEEKGWVADVAIPQLNYAPLATEYFGLELFGSWGGQFQYPASPAADEFVWGFHDLKAGGKLSVPLLPVVKLGGVASYTFRGRTSSTSSRNPDWLVLDPDALPYDSSSPLAWSGLLKLRVQDLLPASPNLLFNYGQVAGETRYGAAIELQGLNFAVFVEALSRQTAASADILNTENGHIQVTPGVAIGDPAATFVKAGYAFSFGSDSVGREWPDEILLGFGVATPLGRHYPPQYGRIAGTVVDAVTGAPLTAFITFPDHPRMRKMQTNPRTGGFRVRKILAGVVRMAVSADGYEPQVAGVEVHGNRRARATIRLAPPVPAEPVSGRVSDRKTGEPLAATIKFPETLIATDSLAGTYQLSLRPGAYPVVVECGDYFAQTATIVVERGRPTVRDFGLVKEGMVITLRGVYFDFDKADIRPESKDNLEYAATILKENPSIKVEIQGHTDSVGTDEYNLKLSDRRAAAVVNNLVKTAGIDSLRLTAKGYGESKPVAPNKTEEGRARNRRVEFVILKRSDQE